MIPKRDLTIIDNLIDGKSNHVNQLSKPHSDDNQISHQDTRPVSWQAMTGYFLLSLYLSTFSLSDNFSW